MENTTITTPRPLKVYLDNCCYNRPYDNQSNHKVYLETQAKMIVQDMARTGEIKLVTSSILDFEVNRSPHEDRKFAITRFINSYSTENILVNASAKIKTLAEQAMQTGVKFYDAYHIACAEYAHCDCFLSTDKRLLKYRSRQMRILNPIDFIKEMENTNE